MISGTTVRNKIHGAEDSSGQVNNGVVYLDYEDSHHGPLLCSIILLYWICLYCLMIYCFVLPFVGVPAWQSM